MKSHIQFLQISLTNVKSKNWQHHSDHYPTHTCIHILYSFGATKNKKQSEIKTTKTTSKRLQAKRIWRRYYWLQFATHSILSATKCKVNMSCRICSSHFVLRWVFPSSSCFFVYSLVFLCCCFVLSFSFTSALSKPKSAMPVRDLYIIYTYMYTRNCSPEISCACSSDCLNNAAHMNTLCTHKHN